MFLPSSHESEVKSLCGLPMAVLQDYLMDGIDGLGDDLGDDFYSGNDDLAGIFDEPLEPFGGPGSSSLQEGLAEPVEKRIKLEDRLEQQEMLQNISGKIKVDKISSHSPPPLLLPETTRPSSSSLQQIKEEPMHLVSRGDESRQPRENDDEEAKPTNRSKSQEQIDRRRDRNRILARRTRLRKKFFFESLQQQVAELERENARLKEIMRSHPQLANENALLECESSLLNTNEKPVITKEHKEATELLTKSDFALMRLVQGAQKSFCITDPSLEDNPIVYASSVFLEQTGYNLDQVVGRNCRFLQGPLTDRSTVDKLRDHIARGEDIGVTILNYRKDGTTFWNQLFVAALRDINKKVVNYVGIQAPVPGPDVEERQLSSGGGMKHPAEEASKRLLPSTLKAEKDDFSLHNEPQASNRMIPADDQHDERLDISAMSEAEEKIINNDHLINHHKTGTPAQEMPSHIDVLNNLIQMPPLLRGTSLRSHSTAATDEVNRGA